MVRAKTGGFIEKAENLIASMTTLLQSAAAKNVVKYDRGAEEIPLAADTEDGAEDAFEPPVTETAAQEICCLCGAPLPEDAIFCCACGARMQFMDVNAGAETA